MSFPHCNYSLWLYSLNKSHGDVTRDDLQRRFLWQLCWNNVVTVWNNVATIFKAVWRWKSSLPIALCRFPLNFSVHLFFPTQHRIIFLHRILRPSGAYQSSLRVVTCRTSKDFAQTLSLWRSTKKSTKYSLILKFRSPLPFVFDTSCTWYSATSR